MNMKPSNHARSALDYLDNLCRRMDRGLRLRRPAAKWWSGGSCIPVGVSLCIMAACASGSPQTISHPVHAAVEVCDDGIDNDGNGRTDCDDDRVCRCDRAYADPPSDPERDCHDGLDDDGDGRVDCYDQDCSSFCSGAEYAAPAPVVSREASCGDGADDDGDGRVDCDDPDCYDVCSNAEYAAPIRVERDCGDGVDNDGDGRADYADADCQHAVALYAAPPRPERDEN